MFMEKKKKKEKQKSLFKSYIILGVGSVSFPTWQHNFLAQLSLACPISFVFGWFRSSKRSSTLRHTFACTIVLTFLLLTCSDSFSMLIGWKLQFRWVFLFLLDSCDFVGILSITYEFLGPIIEHAQHLDTWTTLVVSWRENQQGFKLFQGEEPFDWLLWVTLLGKPIVLEVSVFLYLWLFRCLMVLDLFRLGKDILG